MKRFLMVFMTAVLLLAFCTAADAQWVNGKWIRPHTVKGSSLVENEVAWWFPACADSGTTTKAVTGGGGWTFDASAPAGVVYGAGLGTTYTFDADGGSTGDDIMYLTFPVPANYQTDSLSIDLYWYHLDDNGGTSDVVTWDGTLQAVASGEDLFAAGTAMTAVATTCTASDSALYITTLNPEVETITIGDLLTLKLWADESACSLDSGELAYLLGALVKIRFKE